jgi:hypothetical protein
MILIVLRYKSKLDHYFLFQSIEDFILLVGTSVAFIAFILWCCFPIEPKDSLGGSEHLTTQVQRDISPRVVLLMFLQSLLVMQNDTLVLIFFLHGHLGFRN